MRQPDIEIYLKDADRQTVGTWLEQSLGPCSPWQSKGEVSTCESASGIPIVWLPKAVGKWHSLLLESDNTPWEDDLACARDAYQALQVEIRCAPGGWQEDEQEEEADRWISLTEQGEQEIIWRTG
ncbi:hypothetical protein [Azomonas macrocytogenes]|uniref:Uncharacterized protein n=1 Tax=Azomonas macrocytogenes TaxID=69962 RepID=A0A839T6V6_AZOMA|nr:hypothetical protein [Azomonas macrocytogenes]MBB3104828.1 hypothetical protein [Azomonas macrocytogenes]